MSTKLITDTHRQISIATDAFLSIDHNTYTNYNY